MPRWGMVIDLAKCVGCDACTVACKLENRTPGDIWYAPVVHEEEGTYPNARMVFLPMLCMHCEDAPCAKACPTLALKRRPDGIIMYEEEKCCGSRACVTACPYDAAHFFEGEQERMGSGLEFKYRRHGKSCGVIRPQSRAGP